MKINHVVSFLLIVLAFVLPLEAQATAATPGTAPADGTLKIKDGESIAFLGDSITQFGWQYPGGYVNQVIAGFKSIGLEIKPFPAGVSGNTSANMLDRLKRSVLDRKPTWMTLSCGVNDVWHGAKGVELEPYKQNITSIVDQAQAAGIKVMILTATPIMEVDNDFNKKLADYNDFLRQLAKERNLPLVDMNAAFWEKIMAAHPAGLVLTVDGVHPNPEGNFVFAGNILKAFGVTPDQVAKYEAQWRQSDSAAGVPGGATTAYNAMVSPDVNKNYYGQARTLGLSPAQLGTQLATHAFLSIVQKHEQDPEFAPNLNGYTLSPEVNKVFADLLNALPTAPADTVVPRPPASTTPAETMTPNSTAAAPDLVKISAGISMTGFAPISLTTYQNIMNTVKARKIRLGDLSLQVYFQAVRNVLKAHPEAVTLPLDQINATFVPAVNQEYDNLLKSLPPAPETESAAPATSTTSTPPAPK